MKRSIHGIKKAVSTPSLNTFHCLAHLHHNLHRISKTTFFNKIPAPYGWVFERKILTMFEMAASKLKIWEKVHPSNVIVGDNVDLVKFDLVVHDYAAFVTHRTFQVYLFGEIIS